MSHNWKNYDELIVDIQHDSDESAFRRGGSPTANAFKMKIELANSSILVQEQDVNLSTFILWHIIDSISQ